MDSTASTEPRDARQDDSHNTERAFWQRLLHRWLVQYNPVYLLSAGLVLGGVILISRGLARENTLYGQLGVAAIAEVYAWALIGGAALLTRIGLRRPAVLLALLVALYQGDLTLHTETCAFLGSVGVVAAVAWLALFVAKLVALAWAVRLRLSRSALAVPAFGALGLVLAPHLFRELTVQTRGGVAAAWVFAVFAFALWTAREVQSRDNLDAWGRTVLRRAVRATWLLWAVLALGHLWFWTNEFSMDPAPVVPVAMLLATRWIRREAGVWLAVAATLTLVALVMPPFFPVAAVMSAVVLALRALRRPSRVTQAPVTPESASPYRMPASEAQPADRATPPLTFAPANRQEMWRLLSGAVFCLYLACWTFGWSGGAWPHHELPLDLALSGAAVLLVWKARTRAVLVLLALTWLHAAVQVRLITAPLGELQWGAATVGLGFVLLVGSLLASWRLRALLTEPPAAAPPGSPAGRSRSE